jgi:PAS domain S-box-containing protein
VTSAPIPPDEARRHAALLALNLLDLPEEERFDRITRLAQRVFSVPIALVSLVDDDRQWFKSRAGFGPRELPREFSFCGHAILSDDLFVVPDAAADVRFADNPLVTGETHLRFYAGVPLRGPDRYRVGTLCLIDRVPRQFDGADLAALRDMGHWAELELNVRTVSVANAQAQEQEARVRAIVDHAGDGIITIDQQGLIETFNPAAAAMFGYLPQQVIGEDFRRLMTAEYRAEAMQFLERFSNGKMRPGSRITLDMIGRREDGTTFPAELVVSDMQLAGKRGFNGIVRDLTERKRVEQMKNAFIANVSHELRTPLTSIRGALGLLGSGTFGTLAPQGAALLDIANANCERLARLVDDILDMEKIESGNMQYRMTAQPLLPLIRQAIVTTRDYANGFQVGLHLADDAHDAMIDADGDRLIQVIVNLLSNAAKFSPPGETVEIGTRALLGQVRIAVIDRGPGIPVAFRGRIFQKFAQADDPQTGRKGGTGLGLAISRTIVLRHGGAIGFESTGRGTAFHVDLPLMAGSGMEGSPGEGGDVGA